MIDDDKFKEVKEKISAVFDSEKVTPTGQRLIMIEMLEDIQNEKFSEVLVEAIKSDSDGE